MQSRHNVDWHMARSHIYGLLGSLLSQQPGGPILDQLMQPETVEHLAALFPDPAIGSHFHKIAQQYTCGEVKADQVSLDYESLMRVPGPAYTHPYESFYCNRTGDQTGLHQGRLGGQQVSEIERFYQSEGLTPKYGRVDFADHIGAELTFMAHLCRQQAKALAEENMQTAHLLEEKQTRFSRDHLFRWADDFCAALEAGAVTPFFKGLAHMLSVFINMEKGIVPEG